MGVVLPPLVGAGVLALLVLSGAMAAADLAHPFWQVQATLAGGGAGVLIALLPAWLAQRRGRHPRWPLMAGLAALAATLVVTWRAARVFIASADYEPLAGTVWFFGYHALAALIVITLASAMTAWQYRGRR